VVEQWSGERYLRLLVTDGIDIKAVTRKTRYVDDGQRSTVMARERYICSLTTCDAARRLQLDHCRVDFAQNGPTEVGNLTPLCPYHHALKTKGWRLLGGPGSWRLEPPDP
jgi:predicted restriction endonuclease